MSINISSKNILVCQEDKSKLTEIRNALKTLGCNIISCNTCREAMDICIKSLIDLLILDLNLPDGNGMSVIDFIRSFNNKLPIIVVTSRNNIESKVMAFEAGANDYLTKPFNMLELLARVKNQFRYLAVEDKHVLTNGPLVIDYDAKTVFINGVEVHFTNFEYKIVVLLAQNIDKTLSHDYIIGHIWGENGQDPNGLRVFMAGIRKKINKDPRSSKILRTDVGLGYRMNSVD